MELQRRKGGSVVKTAALVLLGLLIILAAVFFGLFHIRQVDVVGNEYYSADEVKNMVMSDSLSENSIYLTWKYANTDAASQLYFLSDVEVSMINPYHVQIRVYEKQIVGYLLNNGSLVYFDSDGMVVDISQEQREGIPPYSGITITEPAVSQLLPVTDENFLKDIVLAAGLISQSGLNPKEVHYDENHNLILYFKNNRVLLGGSAYMEEKISNLKALFSEMEELEGTLHMEDYTPETKTITFKKGESGEEKLVSDEVQTETVTETEGSSLNMVGITDSTGTAAADGTTGTDANTAANGQTDANAAGNGTNANGTGNVTDNAATDGQTANSQYVQGSTGTDTSGSQYYTDPSGNTTYDMSQKYLNPDGSVITDGYGYIDPYTGAYILN
ncbi:MAG: hypothetical protein Q4B01_04070 [Eubacteriales bacterium]|nr:hypothetical protein [Eubacteriales bacterium]